MIRTRLTGILSTGMLALLAALAVLIGCEDGGKPDTSALNDIGEFTSSTRNPISIRINPATVTLTTVGQEYVFTVQGGTGPYKWRVATQANGKLRIKADNQAIYEVERIANNVVLVTDSKGQSAGATLSSTKALRILPDTVTINDIFGTVQFSVLGGQTPIRYELGSTDIGTITSGGLYTRTGTGQQTVTAIDANDDAVVATVSQPEDVPALTIEPSSATLGTNQTAAAFSVEGGVPPYGWAVGGPGSLAIAANTTSAIYTRPSPTTDGGVVLTVTDAVGQTVLGSITLNQQ